MTKKILVTLISLMMASVAMADRYGRGGYGRGGHHHGGYHGGGHHHGGHHGSDDFGAGVLAGILLSTSGLFLSDITASQAYAVYLNADNDAAEYLAVGGEATPALKQAMNYERKFLAKAQVNGASTFSDQEVAYLVMKRAESL